MLACDTATVARVRRARSPKVELEADEEHEEHHADVRQHAQRRRRLWRHEGRRAGGPEPAEQRRAEHDARQHLADDRRLAEATEHDAERARRGDDHDHRAEDDAERVAGGRAGARPERDAVHARRRDEPLACGPDGQEHGDRRGEDQPVQQERRRPPGAGAAGGPLEIHRPGSR
jgi:hypothetical protein